MSNLKYESSLSVAKDLNQQMKPNFGISNVPHKDAQGFAAHQIMYDYSVNLHCCFHTEFYSVLYTQTNYKVPKTTRYILKPVHFVSGLFQNFRIYAHHIRRHTIDQYINRHMSIYILIIIDVIDLVTDLLKYMEDLLFKGGKHGNWMSTVTKLP